MLHWTNLDQVPVGCAPTVITIGKFDGVHLGHQALLAATTEFAGANQLQSVCLTFDRHPDALLAPQQLRQALTGPTQKSELIAASGIGALLVLPFDRALADMTATDFVETVLVRGLNARHVVLGEGFRFGAKGQGDEALLRSLGEIHGFTVASVPPVVIDGDRVSTSRVRNLLDEGNVTAAARLLGRRHHTLGVVEHGLKLGRQLGFPTANLSRDSEGFLPLDGVYAGWLSCEGQRYPAALSVGINETIQAVPRLLEAHVLDRKDLDLYDRVVDVEYVQFLRPAAKFNGIEELITAIADDCERIRYILTSEG